MKLAVQVGRVVEPRLPARPAICSHAAAPRGLHRFNRSTYSRDCRHVPTLQVLTDLTGFAGEPPVTPGPFLTDYVAGLFRALDAADALDKLIAAGVPASQVNNVADLVDNEHVRAHNDLVSLINHLGQTVTLPGVVRRFHHSPDAPRWLGEELGASNEYVFRTLLGLSADEVAQLHRDGVI